jgi:peptidylprolyl isomerase
MAEAKDGDTVRVGYCGRLVNGAVFDSTAPDKPVEFKIGGKKLIPAFEQAVIGMQAGESKTVRIPSEEAYGAYREGMVFNVARERFPDGAPLSPDQPLRVEGPDGNALIVWITDITDDTITLDANHPLAGKDLTFEINLLDVL